MLLKTTLACILLALTLPALAAGGWNQPWTGVSDTSGGNGLEPGFEVDLGGTGGVPYVAWTRGSSEVRVARVNPATSAWEQPWGSVTGTPATTVTPSVATVDGVPYVGWQQFGEQGTGDVRVARLDGSDAWVQPWSGVTGTYGGVSHAGDRHSFPPKLA